MGYPVDKKAQIHSELALLMPRLASFAVALTGHDGTAHALLKSTRAQALARAAKERGHAPLILWTFQVMNGLWASRMKAQTEKQAAVDPRLFQPRSLGQGGHPAQTVRMAKFLAQLPAQQRATLHLVYGERLSYDEVADVFGVPVSKVMTRLARCHQALHTFEDNGGAMPATLGGPSRADQDGQRGREWAAA
jgi:DNA-directed RNA polymerase specialized sigma24 family protein